MITTYDSFKLINEEGTYKEPVVLSISLPGGEKLDLNLWAQTSTEYFYDDGEGEVLHCSLAIAASQDAVRDMGIGINDGSSFFGKCNLFYSEFRQTLAGGEDPSYPRSLPDWRQLMLHGRDPDGSPTQYDLYDTFPERLLETLPQEESLDDVVLHMEQQEFILALAESSDLVHSFRVMDGLKMGGREMGFVLSDIARENVRPEGKAKPFCEWEGSAHLHLLQNWPFYADAYKEDCRERGVNPTIIDTLLSF